MQSRSWSSACCRSEPFPVSARRCTVKASDSCVSSMAHVGEDDNEGHPAGPTVQPSKMNQGLTRSPRDKLQQLLNQALSQITHAPGFLQCSGRECHSSVDFATHNSGSSVSSGLGRGNYWLGFFRHSLGFLFDLKTYNAENHASSFNSVKEMTRRRGTGGGSVALIAICSSVTLKRHPFGGPQWALTSSLNTLMFTVACQAT